MGDAQPLNNGSNEELATSGCFKNIGWFKTKEGILKAIEILTVLLAWIIILTDRREVDGKPKDPNTYFLVVSLLCWAFTLFVTIFNVFNYHQKYLDNPKFGDSKRLMRTYGWLLLLLAYSLCWVFFWISGAAILLWNKESTAAAVIGFINTILFFVDSILYYRRCREKRILVRKMSRGIENVRL
jgi:hypothetical protein